MFFFHLIKNNYINGIKVLFVVIKLGVRNITTAASSNTLQHCDDLPELLEQLSYVL